MNLTASLPYLNPVYTHQPVTFIVKRLLKKQGIKINSGLLHQKLTEHPYFPSLLSISDVLTEIGIPNQAYKIDLDTLKENFESGVLIHLQIEQGLFCILDKIKDGNFRVITEKGEVKWFAEEDFIKVWPGGVVLDVELTGSAIIPAKTDDTVYPDYLKYLLATCWALLTFSILQNQLLDFTIERSILIILNISGLLISWLLVLQHLNKKNVLVQQLCQSKTQEGCSSVLNNKTAMLTLWLSMAEAGLVYFAGMTFLTLFSNEYSSLYLLYLLAPAFSLYAIYLQAFVIKQWCRLCMAVHAVIFVSFVISLVYWKGSIALPSAKELGIFLLPSLLWFFIKPYIKQLRDASHYQAEYARLKYNPEVFLALINKQPRINIPENLKVFTLGNSNAENELTFVSNPFCGPCAQAHAVINEWLKQELDFKINIIFIHSEDKNDRMRLFTEYISGLKTQNELGKVLHTWYTEPNKDIQKWADNHKLKPSPLLYEDEDLKQWLDTADVHSTPTFFINGYRLPKTYRIADIRYLIPEVPVQYSVTSLPSRQTEIIINNHIRTKKLFDQQ